MNMFRSLAAATTALVLALAAPAHARSVGEVKVPDAVELGGKKLPLNGAALYEATFLAIDIFVAALWLEKPTRSTEVASRCDGPVEFDFFWLYSPSLDDLRGPWLETMRKNAGDERPRFDARIEKLVSAIVAPEEGDRWRFTYVPEVGLTLLANGEPLVTVPGQDFCQLFIRGHVGKTAEPELRRGLLAAR